MIDSNAKLRSIQMPFCTLRYMNNSDGAFKGSTGVFGTAPNFATVNAILNSFGAPTLQYIQNQVSSDLGFDYTADDTSDAVGASDDSYACSGCVYAGAYALGIPNREILKVNFKSPITTETQWTAPLKMQISYN
ncbi:hypothetical protein [Escherichia coli]|uniref:hypothetical protein n=1 Tax=Escherichia coli TaxID=562 RepID=UPI000BE56B9B|nr:hypothetical protein [Escherichia coli]